ncbi:MAG: hypothetical protein A2W61_05505 [Deltaproteobacteria bacterium RIFCSPLOWO2_01_44_7]|nr:MAG: hypothetical protein A2712_07825 [Deltaproteobacteria bacterium RIFCSPHIGHO2_01_FULL_43_49]OGQ14751.1 MAG: hypothetical protein A3D22_09170 [Deltaproteobacteria bacterium RIFCSPHIGHO2_02_FULL_44_53]OGQ28137.1 MAG: hypothetical protein A3D98_07880 [Deltaproteobacteria bacterium RIFCSPHIGHO2_12_FULL_44_21]OGQ31349.1 MAG: hypothetical protein A2979_07930 [Deltaproteobacteria bacterium RIFCSPLOWO2_01_FULL_45_74]OGQ43341.1 MAG: hypothetical protein A3I70_01590 [Deltaproteobacteria bacterium 
MGNELREVRVPKDSEQNMSLLAAIVEAARFTGDPNVLTEEEAKVYILLKQDLSTPCTRWVGPCGDSVEVGDYKCTEERDAKRKFVLENGSQKYLEKHFKDNGAYTESVAQRAARFMKDAAEFLARFKTN